MLTPVYGHECSAGAGIGFDGTGFCPRAGPGGAGPRAQAVAGRHGGVVPSAGAGGFPGGYASQSGEAPGAGLRLDRKAPPARLVPRDGRIVPGSARVPRSSSLREGKVLRRHSRQCRWLFALAVSAGARCRVAEPAALRLGAEDQASRSSGRLDGLLFRRRARVVGSARRVSPGRRNGSRWRRA